MALKDSITTGLTSQTAIHGDTWEAQTFTPTSGYDISYVELLMYKAGTPGTVTVSIYGTSGGDPVTEEVDPLATGTFDGTTLAVGATGTWQPILFSATYTLVADTMYAIVVSNTGIGAGNAVNWKASTASQYVNGTRSGSVNAGVDWSISAANDFGIKTYDGLYNEPVDKVYTKNWISMGGNEVWYESSAGTLEELTDANGDIDTSGSLTAVEAFQKGFIANETNLKVIDLVNVKIVTGDLGANPPDPGTVLTSDGTGNPKMVVDYITSLAGACTIYGKRTTTVTFGASESITGTDDDGNAIAFDMTAVDEVTAPHWYDWGVFGGDSSYGTMPSSAYLVTLYRGRVVLSGDPNYPHQWYMSRVGNPFDFVYSEVDALTAVAGNNTDAGEIGDIVRTMIPFGDDYMVFGCADSIHLMDGDPAAGGSISRMSDTTGIFSPHSWCKDEDGNLYFYGSHGIYIMQGGRSRPTNLSNGALPNLVTDWAVDASTHRVVLEYDADRRGIIFVKTLIETGACEGYFYSLETQGFYPLSIPDACGIFCGKKYDADASSTRISMFGCADGYTRAFFDADKDDDVGTSNTKISSYFGIVDSLSEDMDKNGKLTSLTFELAGGAAGSSFANTDAVSYELHSGNDGETVLENIIDGATAQATGTLSGTGRKNRLRGRIRGANIGIKLYNSTLSQTWGINNIYGNVTPSGRIK